MSSPGEFWKTAIISIALTRVLSLPTKVSPAVFTALTKVGGREGEGHSFPLEVEVDTGKISREYTFVN